MKYFRHAPMTFWLVVCIALVGVTAFGVLYGREAAPAGPRPESITQASQDVFIVRARVSDIHRIAAPPSTGLATWSDQTAQMADNLAQGREDTRGEKDGLAVVYRALAEDSRTLAEADPADTSAILTGVRLVEADADALVAIINGADAKDVLPLPVEDLNVSEEVPFVAPGPIVPGAPAPGGSVPGVPVIPADPSRPPGQPGVPVIPVPSDALNISGGTP